jgi:hypothetical protein
VPVDFIPYQRIEIFSNEKHLANFALGKKLKCKKHKALNQQFCLAPFAVNAN